MKNCAKCGSYMSGVDGCDWCAGFERGVKAGREQCAKIADARAEILTADAQLEYEKWGRSEATLKVSARADEARDLAQRIRETAIGGDEQ